MAKEGEGQAGEATVEGYVYDEGVLPIEPRGGLPIDFGGEKDREGPLDEEEEEAETHQNIVYFNGNGNENGNADGNDNGDEEPTSSPPVTLPLALAYTAFGEPCSDACSNHDGLAYTWCHKVQESNVGTWRDADYCTADPGVTSHGEMCVDECESRGYGYFWCHKDTTLWGYCTPEHLIIKK